MSLCKGKVKIGKKNLKRGTNKYFFKRYLKKELWVYSFRKGQK